MSQMCHKPTFLEAMELTSSGPVTYPPPRIVEVKKKRGPDGGDGASSGSYGGNMMGEGKPHQIVMFSTPCSGRDN